MKFRPAPPAASWRRDQTATRRVSQQRLAKKEKQHVSPSGAVAVESNVFAPRGSHIFGRAMRSLRRVDARRTVPDVSLAAGAVKGDLVLDAITLNNGGHEPWIAVVKRNEGRWSEVERGSRLLPMAQ